MPNQTRAVKPVAVLLPQDAEQLEAMLAYAYAVARARRFAAKEGVR